jgi:hypothetical protein
MSVVELAWDSASIDAYAVVAGEMAAVEALDDWAYLVGKLKKFYAKTPSARTVGVIPDLVAIAVSSKQYEVTVPSSTAVTSIDPSLLQTAVVSTKSIVQVQSTDQLSHVLD